ncbi:MAG: hypothetical protein BSOLF_1321 [Candidatus Carbobacillus altaicus]|uniref:Uncharacterized protein n=1 Tax=Candidatus Carbonibacillus altaicus TaxID=2163959 RepID=A0A2R6XZL0_9BACL|nr:MAG: hypothetical protein BSOLF_1321 [Candidatus Carbobacillus altaicus]
MLWWKLGLWSILLGLLLLSIQPWIRWRPSVFFSIFVISLSVLIGSALLLPPLRWFLLGSWFFLSWPLWAFLLKRQRVLKARARLTSHIRIKDEKQTIDHDASSASA